MPTKRIAFHSDESFATSFDQFKVVAIEDGEPGYWTVDTRPTLAEAKAEAAARNQAAGLTEQDVLDIRTTSMAAHIAANR